MLSNCCFSDVCHLAEILIVVLEGISVEVKDVLQAVQEVVVRAMVLKDQHIAEVCKILLVNWKAGNERINLEKAVLNAQ